MNLGPLAPVPQGNIAFDLDGVLFNFIRGFTRIGQRLYGGVVSDQPAQDNWIFEAMPSLNLTKEQVGHPIKGGGMWAEVIASKFFWANLDPINVSILHTIDQIRNKVFITNRLGQMPREQSVSSLERWGVIEPTVIVTADKGPAARESKVVAFIDDYFPNCTDMTQAMPDAFVSLLAVPYNASYRTETAVKTPQWSPARLWGSEQVTPAQWQGHVSLSVDHFIKECDRRGLIVWDSSYTVDKDTRQLEKHIVAEELEREAHLL